MKAPHILQSSAMILMVLSPAAHCETGEARDPTPPAPIAGGAAAFHSEATRLIAVIRPLGKSGVTGTVEFEASDNGARLTATLTGLVPELRHSIQIHEFGDLGGEHASSAGGPFKPAASSPDRFPGPPSSPAEFQADAKGHASIALDLTGLTLGHGARGILGRSVIVHGPATDPTPGGSRIGAGVIGLAMSKSPGSLPSLPEHLEIR